MKDYREDWKAKYIALSEKVFDLEEKIKAKDEVIDAVEDWRANLRCSYHNNQCMKLANSIDEYDKYKEAIK